MTTSYASIKNNKGMSAQVIACVWGESDEGYGRKTLYALDVAGAHTAVKAIWASVMNGSVLKPAGFAHHKTLRAEKETDFLAIRRAVLPGINHYSMVVEPKPTASCLVITSQLGAGREEALARFLNIHTLYPVLPEWGDVLFGEGVKGKLVTKLSVFGLEWAYKVDMFGWDELLDSTSKSGLLHFPQAA